MVVSILETTTQHGAIVEKRQNRETKFYNSDAIIAVGYRVNSTQATQYGQSSFANEQLGFYKRLRCFLVFFALYIALYNISCLCIFSV